VTAQAHTTETMFATLSHSVQRGAVRVVVGPKLGQHRWTLPTAQQQRRWVDQFLKGTGAKRVGPRRYTGTTAQGDAVFFYPITTPKED